jgi:hypothetical protein
MGWINGGRPQGRAHKCSPPPILRLGRFGADVGSQWSCDDCTCVWEVWKTVGGQFSWRKLDDEADREETGSLHLGKPQPGPTVTEDGARLIPHTRESFVAALADTFHAGDMNEDQRVWLVGQLLGKLEGWSYIAFPASVPGATVDGGTD